MPDPASTPETSPGAGTGSRRLLAFTDDRTIWLQREGEVDIVRKVFERGTPAQAEAEAYLGERLRGDGFVRYLGVERDPQTQRPSTLTEYVPASDLTRWVAARGPLAPRTIAALGVALCRILRRVHAIAVHRDVKPSNVLAQIHNDGALTLVTLLDAEHVWLLRSAAPSPGPFTGGTHGWSPPEAYAGATPTPAFDVFGLGATLWYAALGWPPLRHGTTADQRTPARRDLAVLPSELAAVLLASLAGDVRQRPSPAQIEAALAAYLERAPAPADELLSAAHDAVLRGDLATAEVILDGASAPADAPRLRALRALLAQRRRLLARRPLPAQSSAAPPLTIDAIAPRASLLYTFARRFPALVGLREAIGQLRDAAGTLLDGVPAAVAAHKRVAEFAAALAQLAAANAAIVALAPLGGPTHRLAGGAAPSALQRTPQRLLRLAQDDLAAASQRHDALLAELAAAEANLDVSAAVQAIDHAAGVYGGASEVVASLKDRLHRLTFFVERLAQPSEVLTPLANELAAGDDALDLTAVAQCFERCRHQSQPNQAPKGALGLRTLLRTLQELGEELPATAPNLVPAAQTLGRALQQVSLRAWSLVEDGHHKLASVPIPIRPLQNQIARLDHLRLIDALIDSPRGSRAELLDELERLRSDVDQARTTRDRIASGARAAMERGHLTTALYDMARAVDRYDAPAAELESARKRKHAVEEAVRENHRLAARHAELEDDPSSALAQRIEALEQRRAILEFLSQQVAAERASTYAQDLLDVEVRMLQERAADAERRLDTLSEPAARLELTTATLATLGGFARDRGEERDRLGRVQRLSDHWRSMHTRAHHDVQREAAARRDAWRRRRRSLLARGLVGFLAMSLAIALFLLVRSDASVALGNAANAVRNQLVTPLRQEDFEPLQAVLALDRFAVGIEGSGLSRTNIAAAGELVRATRALADHASAMARGSVNWARWESDLQRLQGDFERASNGFAADGSPHAEELRQALSRFGKATEISAVLLAARAAGSDAERALVQRYARARNLELRQ